MIPDIPDWMIEEIIEYVDGKVKYFKNEFKNAESKYDKYNAVSNFKGQVDRNISRKLGNMLR